MLKLNASYSKKVPAGEEYSSQSYHASVEVELPDGLSGEALQARIHETFDLVRNSVEAELHGKSPANYGRKWSEKPSKNGPKTLRKAGGLETIRTMVRQARNSSRICSTLPGSAASLRSRSRRGFRCRTSSI